MKKTSPTTEPCPCGGASYTACCAPYHLGTPAPTAEALMRARYSAFVRTLEPYLLATWHPDTRPDSLNLAEDNTPWLGLKVIRHEVESDDRATVEFIARYKINGRAHRLHETSRFVREHCLWLYVDGTHQE